MPSQFFKTGNLAKGLFKACIIPRPIGWITTMSTQGKANLAPFSYFTAVSDDPPMVLFSTTDSHIEGGPKDTLRNVEATGEFVVNLATYNLRKKMNLTSLELPKEQSEFEYANIESISSLLVKPPRVKASPIHLECRYFTSIQLPTGSASKINRMVIGKVEGIHVDESVMTKGKIDLKKLKPIARLGYHDFLMLNGKNQFTMKRPEQLILYKNQIEKNKRNGFGLTENQKSLNFNGLEKELNHGKYAHKNQFNKK